MKLAFSGKLHKDILTYTLDPSVINRVCVVGGGGGGGPPIEMR